MPACLPEFPPGQTLLVYDSQIEPYDGDLISVTLVRPTVFDAIETHTTKRLKYAKGTWWLWSDEGEHLFENVVDAITAMKVLVASAQFGPSWPTVSEADAPAHLQAFGIARLPAFSQWPGWPDPPVLDHLGIRALPARPRAFTAKRRLPPLSTFISD